MKFAQSFTYIFDDDDWVAKVGITLLVSLAAGLLSVILVGLVFQAALLGWTVHLVRNMRDGDTYPMPTWSEFGSKVSLGLTPMIAAVLYSLLPLSLLCVFVLPLAVLPESAAESAVLLVFCILMPILILYSIMMSLLFAVGMIRYSERENMSAFLGLGTSWRMLTRNGSLTGQFVLFVIIAQFVLGLVASTGIGGLVSAALSPAVIGNLLGQYAVALDAKPKRRG